MLYQIIKSAPAQFIKAANFALLSHQCSPMLALHVPCFKPSFFSHLLNTTACIKLAFTGEFYKCLTPPPYLCILYLRYLEGISFLVLPHPPRPLDIETKF